MRGHPATSCCSQNMIYNINLVRSYFYSLDIVSISYYNNTLHGNTEHLTSFLYICLAFFLGCYQIFCCANSSQNYRDVIRVVIKLIHLLQSLFIKRSCCDSRSQGVCVGTSWADDFVFNWKILKFLDVLVSLHPSNPKNLSTLRCEILDFYAPELSSLPIIRADHNIWGLQGSKAYCCPPPECMGPDHENNTQNATFVYGIFCSLMVKRPNNCSRTSFLFLDLLTGVLAVSNNGN